MAKVIVYDEYTNRLFTYNLSENDPMPYAYGNTMRVREFRGSSNSPTLWKVCTNGSSELLTNISKIGRASCRERV